MDSFFYYLFQWVATFIRIMDEDFVFTVGGFSFSLWDFELACFLLCIIIPTIMITRSSPVETQTSERSRSSVREWSSENDSVSERHGV